MMAVCSSLFVKLRHAIFCDEIKRRRELKEKKVMLVAVAELFVPHLTLFARYIISINTSLRQKM